MNSVQEESRIQVPDIADKVETLQKHLAANLTESAATLVIAGSGLGGFVRTVSAEKVISYSDLPHVGASTVAGHAGSLVFGYVANTPLLLMNGRRHLYEGMPAQENTLLLRALLAGKAIRNVIVSNAAGGLNPLFEVGDLMLLSDSINWTFRNPLIGRNKDSWGPRFPDASELYSRRLRELARECAATQQILLREGVYLAGHGPSYETRAEVGMLRYVFCADAVGMSTVPEALVAAHMGRRVLGISFISNLLTEPAVTSHEEVMANAAKVEQKFCNLLTALLPVLESDAIE
jgi:purine-nucleoside phosphorylase